ncbi:unnamed protein product [Mytilus coruscus]|uniref:Chitin-binding type-2 domain-containing protein n=1 Tax=Mytilus coruscus TaxID=42192 RepID=A0A6J8C5H9_MYTCO|nr:unnamed protein product [Mytilus coruscus]
MAAKMEVSDIDFLKFFYNSKLFGLRGVDEHRNGTTMIRWKAIVYFFQGQSQQNVLWIKDVHVKFGEQSVDVNKLSNIKKTESREPSNSAGGGFGTGATAAATFFATKHFYSENKGKYTDSTQCNVTSENGYNQTIDSPGSCLIEPCENGGTCVNTTCLCQDGFAGSKCEIDVNQTCKADADTFIPHPNTCQLFYNCSQALTPLPTEDRIYSYNPQILRPAYLHECPYPELFSMKTMSCQNYTEVECGSRYETKNKCDYLAISYTCVSACKQCIYFTPDCVGFADGIYDNIYISIGGTYFECKDERNIYGGANPCPTGMAPYNGECKDLFEIPINLFGIGNGVNYNDRENGNYKSERFRRCDIYYTCVNGILTLSHCDSGKTFDSKSSFCQIPTNACSPCGSVVNGC